MLRINGIGRQCSALGGSSYAGAHHCDVAKIVRCASNSYVEMRKGKKSAIREIVGAKVK